MTDSAATHIGPEAQFQHFLASGRFMIQRCRSSGRYIFYPRVAEPASGDPELEWVEASGEGSIYSVTIVRPNPPLEPYSVVLVDLAEGPRLMSTVQGIAPEGVRIGMRVRSRIVSSEGQHRIVFEALR